VTQLPDALAAALAGSYLIERPLGAGGMATVFLAEDVRHHRKVAVKVLHPELSAVLGPERFLQEIALTARLQHPHILPLFDSGSVDGQLYYVMPVVEGETLRGRLAREHQLPVSDALRIAGEIADALDYAHRHGVVHRDIKPENVLLHDGHALVADFGIALAVSEAGGERMTQTGLSLGTPQYMAPEQAMGERVVDARADVYALGAVLYEMLSGEPPFTGPTAQAIVARVLTDEPRSLVAARRSVPPQVDDAVRTALEKLPADRFANAADFAAALRQPMGEPRGARRSAEPVRRPLLAWGAAAVVAAALVAVAAYALGNRNGSRTAVPLAFERAVQVTADPGLEVMPALSPDGRSVAYAAGTSASLRIFVRPVAGGRPIALTSDSADVQTDPHWSRDGNRVLFLSRGSAFSAPASGGPARPELPAPRGGGLAWADWSPDGASIGYVVEDSLFVRDAGGATRRLAVFLEPSLCSWSPDGARIACASGNRQFTTPGMRYGNLSPSWIVVCRLRDGDTTTVTSRTSLNHSPLWSVDGRWLYFVSNRYGPRDVFAQRIGRDGRADGAPVRLTTGLGAQSISRSADGRRLAYAAFGATGNVWSLPLRPDGTPSSNATPTPVTSGNELTENLSLSADERWLYYDSNLGGNADIYRRALPNGEPERLTTDPADDFAPDPSPDGREVAFHSWRGGSRDIYVLPLDGGPIQQVTHSPQQEWLASWSPDGRALAFTENSARGGLWVVRRGADGAWGEPVQRAMPAFQRPGWSPDGRFIAVASSDPDYGDAGLLVVPADSGSPRVVLAPNTISTGVWHPIWRPDGRIYFKTHDRAGAAIFESVPSTGGAPRLLGAYADPLHPSYRGKWSLARDKVYFTIEDRRSDVWVLDVVPR
jgi:serine/threonine-protein kinase